MEGVSAITEMLFHLRFVFYINYDCCNRNQQIQGYCIKAITIYYLKQIYIYVYIVYIFNKCK